MTLQIWKANRLPLLTDTITASGSPFDLTGATVTFSMRPTNSSSLKVSGATAQIVSAAAGSVSYAWTSTDVDSVGNYYGWWTYNILGKSQDTPEFEISVVEHTPPLISIWTPVAADGSTTIYKGDTYLYASGRGLVYELAPQGAPDLTAGTVVYRVEGEFHTNMTAVDKSTVYVNLNSTQTNIPAGKYSFQIEALLAAASPTVLLRSSLTVLDQMTSP